MVCGHYMNMQESRRLSHSIVVTDLSKEYRIGITNASTTFREALIGFVKRPLCLRRAKDKTIWALKDISFTVDEGEIVGIIGRNGAGKSTLLKAISKITFPTSGDIKVHGRLGSLLEVGTGFHEELTGRENIYFNGSILGMTRKEISSKFDEIAAFANVDEFIDTPIKRYSSGMKMRLGFAVAAHLDTSVLLVDEVLAVGDVEFQKKCISKMENLRYGGRTILFVSHNMSAIENLCSRAIWIEGGRIKQDGKPKDVILGYMESISNLQGSGDGLRGAKTRRGSGLIRFTGVEFLSSNRTPAGPIRCGDKLIVRLHFQAARMNLGTVNFTFRIFTELGTLVADFSTVNTGTVISDVVPGESYIDAEIEFLNLMPSRYYVSLWAYDRAYELYDGVDLCASFDVEEADVYNSGQGMIKSNGIVFFPYKWLRGSPGMRANVTSQ